MATRRKARPDLSNIVEPLRKLAVPIDSLTPDPDNARVHNARNMDALRSSLLKLGQYLPLVVKADGMVVMIGNARWSIMRSLGWTHCAAVVCDDDELVHLQRAIADNRTGELGEFDDAALARALAKLDVIDDVEGLADLGFGKEEVDAMLADLESSLDGIEDELAGKGRETSGAGADPVSRSPRSFTIRREGELELVGLEDEDNARVRIAGRDLAQLIGERCGSLDGPVGRARLVLVVDQSHLDIDEEEQQP